MKGLGSALWFSRVFHDGALELGDTLEGAAPDAFAGDLGKEALHHIEPGRRGRREVEMEARMRLEPALHAGGLVGGIVVDDQVKVEIGRGLLIDEFEKAQELAVPMARPSSMLSAANKVVVPLRL